MATVEQHKRGGRGSPRSYNPLAAVLAEATRGGRVLRRCEFHLKVEKHREGLVYDNATFERLCREHLPPVLPEGVELTLVRCVSNSPGSRRRASVDGA